MELLRKAVATNPKTPTEVLFELGVEFPEQLLENPMMLENPNFLLEMPQDTLESLFDCDRTPMLVFEQAANHANEFVRQALADNLQTPVSVLEQLVLIEQERAFPAWYERLTQRHFER